MLFLLVVTSMIYAITAEPPVSDGFSGYQSASARSSHDHHQHGNGFEREGPSQEYGASVQATQNGDLSQEYGAPSLRNADFSQEYGAPALRNGGLSQEYGSSYMGNGVISQLYNAPSQRSNIPPQSYGAPSLRNSHSQGERSGHGFGSQRNSISQEYGSPSQRSSFGSSLQTNSPSESYDIPSSRSSLSTQYGAPNLRNAGKSYTQGSQSRSVSESYGAPSQRSLSQQNGAPSEKSGGLSHEYSFPSLRNGHSQKSGTPSLRSNAFSHGSPSARNGPSQSYSASNIRSGSSDSYGAPDASARNFGGMPSEEYGLPSNSDALSNEGSSYARNAQDEYEDQEPANYNFGYQVSDGEGSDFGHQETRQENRAEGSYFVVLPDGTKQVVEYEADENGFRPRISVEPAETGYGEAAVRAGGNGPY